MANGAGKPPTEAATRNGFRMRGLEMNRIETFTDAAFAFALTLLVISFDPPGSFAELSEALRGIPAFLLSATLLMVFWWGHHEWSRRYGLEDGPTVVLSCLLVFTVLVYVYPLRFMFGLMMEWLALISDLPLGSGAVTVAGIDDVNRLFALYGTGFVAMAGSLVLLNLHAWRRRDALALSAWERRETLATAGAWGLVAAVGALSVLTALLTPPSWIGLPGWIYCALPVLMPLYGRWMSRRRPDLAAAVGAGRALGE